MVTALLRLIATVFVLAPLIGFLVTAAMMMHILNAGFNANGEANQRAIASSVSICLVTTSCSFLLFPVGVFLHWIIARKTHSFSSGARRALFWGSLFMCIGFPVGTILGGVTLWLLIASPVFQSRPLSKTTCPFKPSTNDQGNEGYLPASNGGQRD
jgi:hypothetical protein